MDDRIALRLGALRLARRRGRTRDAAWAASRLRLAGVTLDAGDARFARDVRVKFGRALRIARVRRPRSAAANVTMPLLLEATPSRSRRIAAALVAAALLLGALLLYFRFQEPGGAPEGAPPAQAVAVATPPPPLRGRTQPGLAVPVAVIVEATPAPTDAPVQISATPAPVGSGTGAAGGGIGGGGSGGGSGTGKGTPAPTVAPTPSPSPAPTVTPNPANVMHVRGRVVDAITRRGIPNVCVAIGAVTCQGAPVTDAQGFFAVDLTIGRILNWQLTFITPGYITQQVRIPSRAGTVTVPDVRLRVGP